MTAAGAHAEEPAIACDLTVFSADESARHKELLTSMRAAMKEVERSPGTLSVRLPAHLAGPAAEWAALERRCCSFFGFELELAAGDGPLRFTVRGPEDALSALVADSTPARA